MFRVTDGERQRRSPCRPGARAGPQRGHGLPGDPVRRERHRGGHLPRPARCPPTAAYTLTMGRQPAAVPDVIEARIIGAVGWRLPERGRRPSSAPTTTATAHSEVHLRADDCPGPSGARVAQSARPRDRGRSTHEDGTHMIRKTLALAALLLGLIASVGAAPRPAAGGGPSDYANCLVTVEPSIFEAGRHRHGPGHGLRAQLRDDHRVQQRHGAGRHGHHRRGGLLRDRRSPSPTTPTTVPHTITARVRRGRQHQLHRRHRVEHHRHHLHPAGGGPLPRTGSDSEPLLVAGAIAVLVGIAFVLVARRRRRGAAEH